MSYQTYRGSTVQRYRRFTGGTGRVIAQRGVGLKPPPGRNAEGGQPKRQMNLLVWVESMPEVVLVHVQVQGRYR